jgi:serine/threonine-protein kinase RsbW
LPSADPGTTCTMAETPPAAHAPSEVVLPAVPESVTTARHEVAAYLDRHAFANPAAELVVSEAVKNAVEHAFRGRGSGTIVVRLELLVPDTLAVSVADDGVGFTPDLDSEGLGVGLSLIGRLCSDFEVTARQPHGTVVQMRLPVSPPPAAGK